MCNYREPVKLEPEFIVKEGDSVRIKQITGISGGSPYLKSSFVFLAQVLAVAGEFAVVQRKPMEPIAVRLDDLRQWRQAPLSSPSL